MAKQTFAIGAVSSQSITGSYVDWNPNSNNRIDASFVAGTDPAYFRNFTLPRTNSRNVELTTSATATQTGTLSGPQLADSWESNPNAVEVRVGSLSVQFGGPTAPGNTITDTTEPYVWNPSAAERTRISTFVEAFVALTENERATAVLILDDGLTPDASAGNASVSINAISAGDEGTSVQLGASITKGTGVYDTVSYAWTADSGTLSGANTATPTWTRPQVTSTQNVTIRLVVTLQGDGTTAKSGTSVALAEVTRSASVRNVLPVASAPTVSINAIAAGDEGTTVTLGASIGAGGQYDGSVSYNWSVDEGTLNDATAAAPVWTRPQVTATKTVDVNLRITVSGDGTTTRNGTSANRDAAEVSATVRNVLPDAIAPNVSIDSIAAGDEGASVSLTATITGGAYDSAITYAWSVDEGTLSDSTAASPTWTRPSVTATKTVDVNLRITVSGSGGFARSGTTASRDAAEVSATVRNVFPDAIAPAVSINAVSNGNEGTTATLGAVLTGGNYDAIAYAWTVSHGTLNNAAGSTPVWTRPQVASDTAVTIDLRITATGTGTNARSGTSSISNATQVTTTVLNVLPVASAGSASVSIDAISAGNEDTSVNLSASITKGTGVYDSVSYAWTADSGTLSGENTATPTWTRPLVTSTQNVTIRLVLTLQGTGTTARSGTSVALGQVTRSASVVNVPDITPPTLQSIETNAEGTSITLTYNEALDTSSVPAAGDFTLSPDNTISGVTVTGSTVALAISTAFIAGETITLDYAVGTNPIQDAEGNDAPAFSGEAVTNNVPLPYQVFNLEAAEYLVGTVSKRWLKNPRPLVNANLCPPGQTRYLDLVVARREDDRGGVFHFEPVLTGTRTNGHDLSAQVEAAGIFRITVGETHFDFPVNLDTGGDEPYAIDFSGDTQTAYNAWQAALSTTAGDEAGTFTIWNGLAPSPFGPDTIIGTGEPIAQELSVSKPEGVDPRAAINPITQELAVSRISSLTYAPPAGSRLPQTYTLDLGTPTDLFGNDQWTGRRDIGPFSVYEVFSASTQVRVLLIPPSGWANTGSITLTGQGGTVALDASDAAQGGTGGLQGGVTLTWTTAQARAWATAQNALTGDNSVTLGIVNQEFVPFLAGDVSIGEPFGFIPAIGQPLTLDQALSRPVALVKRSVQPITLDLGLSRPIALVKRSAQPISIALDLSRPYPYALPNSISQGMGIGKPMGFVKRAPQPIAIEQAVTKPQGFKPAAGVPNPVALTMALGNPRGYLPKVGARPIAIEQAVSHPHTFVHIKFILEEQAVGKVIALVRRGTKAITINQSVGRPSTFRHAVGIAIELALNRPSAARPPKIGVPGRRISDSETLNIGAPNLSTATFVSYFSGTPGDDFTVTEIVVFGTQINIQITAFLPDWPANGTLTLTAANGSITVPGATPNQSNRVIYTGQGDWVTSLLALDESDQSLSVTFDLEEFQEYIATDQAVGRPEYTAGAVTRVGIPNPISLGLGLSRPHAFAHAEFVQTDLAVGMPRGYFPKVAADPISIEQALGRPHAYSHAEFILQEYAVGMPQGFKPTPGEAKPITFVLAVGHPGVSTSRGAQPIVQDLGVGSPASVLFGIPGSTEAGEDTSETRALGVRNRTRGGGSIWEWNQGFTLPSPIVNSDGTSVAAIRLRADQVRIIDSGNDDPGFSAEFKADGTLTLTHIGGSSFTFDAPTFDSDGRLDLSDEPDWAAWWTAFSQDATNELSVTFTLLGGQFVPFIALDMVVGQPVGRVSRPAELSAIAIEQSLGRAHAYAHAEFVQIDMAVGMPRGYFPKIAAQPIAQEQATGKPHGFAHAEFVALEYAVGMPQGFTPASGEGKPITLVGALGNPGVSTSRGASPIALEQSTSRPHAFAHAEFVQTDLAVGRPRGYLPKIAARPVTIEHGVSQPHAYSHAEFILQEIAVGRPGVSTTRGVQPITLAHAVGMPQGIKPAAGDGKPLALTMGVGRPRGFIPKIAAQPIAQEMSLGRAHAYAHAEFVQIDLAVGMPASVLFGVPGSTEAGETVTESHDFGTRTLVRTDANSTWQFNSNLTLPEPIMTATASPILQAHVRANQLRFIATAGQNPGFSADFIARGRVTWARVGGTSFTIVGPPFDHLGRIDTTGLDGYAEWWAAFSEGGAATELEVTWELDGTQFVPYLAGDMALGNPRGYIPKVSAQAIAIEEAVSQPHGFAHAEFILQEYAVGNPGVSTSRGASPITIEQAVGMPQGIKPAEGEANPIATALALGNPRGYIPRVAAQPIAAELSTSRPHGFAHAEFVQIDLAVGNPRGYFPKVAAQPIAQQQSTSRPHGFAHAEFILLELALGRPGVSTSRGVRPIASGLAVGMPQGIKPAEGETKPISTVLALGNPQGYIARVSAQPIAQVLSTSRPHGFAHAEFVALDYAVGMPRGYFPKIAAQPISVEQATSRPHGFAHAEFILQEYTVGRPRVTTTRATRPITQEQAVGMPQGIKPAAGDGKPIALEMALGNPRGFIPKVSAQPVTIELSLGRAHAFAHAEFVQTDLAVGNPRGYIPKVAAQAITLDQAVSKPHGFAHAEFILLEQVVGMPQGIMPAAGDGRPIALIMSVGHPGVSTSRGTQPIASELSLGRAHAYAHAEFVQTDMALGNPRGYIARVAALPITLEQLPDVIRIVPAKIGVPGGRAPAQWTGNTGNPVIARTGLHGWTDVPDIGPFVIGRFSVTTTTVQILITPPSADFLTTGAITFSGSVGSVTLNVSDARILDGSFDSAEKIITWRTATSGAWSRQQVALESNRDIDLTIFGSTFVPYLAGEVDVSRPHGFGHAEFILQEFDVGRVLGSVKRAVSSITIDQVVGRPVGQVPIFGVPFPAEFSFDFGARNRTRSGGSIWEWNDDDLQLEPPFGTDDARVLNRLRMAANQIRFTDASNDDPGFSTKFKADGILHLSSPGVGDVAVAEHNILVNGRLDPRSNPGWSEWWTAFSADTSNTLSIRFEIPGAEIIQDVGRPVGDMDRTKYGEPEPVAITLAVGRAHAFAHAEFVQTDLAVGRPRISTTKGVRPIAQEQSTGRAHAYAHAEFVQTDLAVGRPRGYFPKVAARPVAQQQSTSRPHGFAHAEFILQEYAVGMPQGITPAAGDGQPITLTMSVGKPGISTSRAARPISISYALGRAHAFAHAEFVQTDIAVGRPKGYIPKVAARQIEQAIAVGRPDGVRRRFAIGIPIVELQDVGRPRTSTTRAVRPITLEQALSRPHGFAHAEFILGLYDVGRPGVSTSRAAQPIAVEQSTSRPHGFAHAEFVQTDLAVGRPNVLVKRSIQQIEIEQSLSRPHAFAHAEFVQIDLSVGRPSVLVRRAIQQIAIDQALSRPHAYSHAEFILQEYAVGRPGVATSRGIRPISIEQSTSRPHGFAHAEFVQTDLAVGRPRTSTTRAVRPIVQEQSTGRAHAYAHAEFVQTDLAVGRPGVTTTRAAQPITQEQSLSRPTIVLISHARPITQDAITGRPRGYIQSVAARGIAAVQSTGMPEGERRRTGVGRPISLAQSVGRPRGYIQTRTLPVAIDIALSRPQRYFPKRSPRVQEEADAKVPATGTTASVTDSSTSSAPLIFVGSDITTGTATAKVKAIKSSTRAA